MEKWYVNVGERRHDVVFERSKMFGKAMISIDGIQKEYAPVFVRNIGTFYLFEIESDEFLLKLVHNAPQGLIQNGHYIETGLPLEDEAVEGLHAAFLSQDPLTAKNKAHMGSFLTFVVLTFVNMFLIAVNSSFSFPFSATVPQFLFSLGFYADQLIVPIAPAVLFIAGIVCGAVYLILYLLARRRTWPIVTALILVAVDTAFLVYLSIGDFSSSIIDIAFHAWVLWSIIQLYRTRRRLVKAAVRDDLNQSGAPQ